MQGKFKYVWDVGVEKDLNKKQENAINQISGIISNGGNTKLIKKNFKILNL